jgi:hypothetical protein
MIFWLLSIFVFLNKCHEISLIDNLFKLPERISHMALYSDMYKQSVYRHKQTIG